MRFSIQEIKKETFKFLGGYFGLRTDQEMIKQPNPDYRHKQTPDCYNSRLNGNHRKNHIATRHPH